VIHCPYKKKYIYTRARGRKQIFTARKKGGFALSVLLRVLPYNVGGSRKRTRGAQKNNDLPEKSRYDEEKHEKKIPNDEPWNRFKTALRTMKRTLKSAAVATCCEAAFWVMTITVYELEVTKITFWLV